MDNKILVVSQDLSLLKRARILLADTSMEVFTAQDAMTAKKILEAKKMELHSIYIQQSFTEADKISLVELAEKNKISMHELCLDQFGYILIK